MAGSAASYQATAPVTPDSGCPLGLESLCGGSVAGAGVKRGEAAREALRPGAPDLANTATARLGRIDGPVLAHNDAVRVSQLRARRGPTIS